MLDNEKLSLIEKKFSFFNIVISIFLLIYYFLFVWFEYEELGLNTFIFSLLILFFVIEYILSQHEYLNSDFIFKIIKFCELFSASAVIFACAGFEMTIILYTLIYSMIAIQVLLTYDITEKYSIAGSIVFNIIPMCMVMAYCFIFNKSGNFWIFAFIDFSVIFILCFLNITGCLSNVINYLYEKITVLNGDVAVNRSENDSMKSTHDKLVHANEQLSIQKFKLQEANEKIVMNNAEMKLQKMITDRFLDSMDIQELPDIITSAVFEHLDCDLFSMNVLYRNDNNNLMWLHNSKYTPRTEITDKVLEKIENKNLVADVCKKNERVRVDDYANIKLDYFEGTNIKSVIITPVKFNDNIIATYMLGNTFKNKYGEKDDFINSLSNQITLALSNAFLYYEMRVMAIKDPLTGIYNRRYFNGMSDKYKKNYIDKNINITVVLFDIDRFKSVNDNYGHIFGDEVISYCGQMADKYSEAANGLPVRYGGEEFVIVFPDKTSDEAADICDRLHKEIKEKEFEFKGTKVHIDVSIGIANYPKDGNEFEEIVNHADSAMYYSKKHGRGRITVYGKDM